MFADVEVAGIHNNRLATNVESSIRIFFTKDWFLE